MRNLSSLSNKEHRRQLVALCKCASDDEERPSLSYVMFDGTAVYATDSRILATLPFNVDVPRPRMLLPAKRLAKALGLAGTDDEVTLAFHDDEAVLRIGSETLPIEGMPEPTTVTLGYAEEDTPYPDLDAWLTEPDPDVERTLPERIGVNAKLLAQLGAVAPRGEGAMDDAVVLVPRSEHGPIDVFTVERQRLGVIMPLRTWW